MSGFGPRWSLLRSFALGSLLIFVIVGLGLYWLIGADTVRDLRDQARNDAQVISGAMSSSNLIKPDYIANGIRPEELIGLLPIASALEADGETWEAVTLYNEEGLVVLSTDVASFGERIELTESLERALLGEETQEVVDRDDLALPNLAAGTKIVTAVPFRLDGEVVGAFEVVVSIENELASVRSKLISRLAIIGGGLLLIWLSLIVVFFRLSRVSDRQRQTAEELLGRERQAVAREKQLREDLWTLAEACLDAERAKLDTVIKSMGDGLCAIDDQGRLEYMNPEAEHLLGVDLGSVAGRRLPAVLQIVDPITERPLEIVDDLGDQQLAQLMMRRWEDLADGDVPEGTVRPISQNRDGEFRVVNGVKFPANFTINPLETDGKITGAVLVFHDITERKEIERIKDEFVSTVSHELRTLLTSISGALGYLESVGEDTMTEQSREILHIANKNAARLARLINDILSIQRYESGHLVMRPNVFDMTEFVDDVIDRVRGFAAERNITITVDDASDNDIKLLADRDRIEQVLTNLIANAVEYSPPNSAIRLLTARRDGGMFRVSVIDHGPGIATEDLAGLFDKFHQIASSDRREHGGTGLGLAIARAIVREHDGRVGVESSVGAGSTFWFDLHEAVDADDEASPPNRGDHDDQDVWKRHGLRTDSAENNGLPVAPA